jgi:hypothetical protein
MIYSRNMVCFRYINENTLYKSDNKYDDDGGGSDDNNNNINNK